MRKNRPIILSCFLLAAATTACEEAEPVSPPRQLPGSPFHYPEELWDAGVEGETMLRLWVNPQGAVDSVRIEKTSDYAAFDSSAVNGTTPT